MRFIFRSFRLSAPRATSAAEVNITPALPKGAKRQTPKTRRPAKGSPTRGAVTAKSVTERFNPGAVELCETERAPKTFFKKSRKKVKGICVSCIIESETANIQHKTARYINAAGRADKLECTTPRNDIATVHNVLYIAEYFV